MTRKMQKPAELKIGLLVPVWNRTSRKMTVYSACCVRLDLVHRRSIRGWLDAHLRAQLAEASR